MAEKMYSSIRVERAKVTPIEFLNITFDVGTLNQFEEFLKEVVEMAPSRFARTEYAKQMLANIKAMKGY